MFKYNRDDKNDIVSIGNIENCLKSAVSKNSLYEYVNDERLFIERVLQDVVAVNVIKDIIKPNTQGNHRTIYYRVVSFGNRDTRNPSKYAHAMLGREIETLAKTDKLINYLSSSVRKNVVIPIEKMIKEEDSMDDEVYEFYDNAVMLLQDLLTDENTFYESVNKKIDEIVGAINSTDNNSLKRNSFCEFISWLVALSLLQDRIDKLFPKGSCFTKKDMNDCQDFDDVFIKNIKTKVTERLPSLRSTPYESSIKVIGRDDEMNLIHRYLKNERVVFLSSVGGCGKTQLVLRYISENRSVYNTIVMAKFETSLSDLLNNDVYFNIEGFSRKNDESDMEYAKRKLRKLAQITDENDLIVIDNFDTLADDLLKELLHLPCRLLFTTRTNFDYLLYPQIILGTLKIDEQKQLFEQNYRRKIQPSDYEILYEILEYISGHTLTIVLFARHMDKHRIRFSEMLKKLRTEGISPSMRGSIPNMTGENANVYNHILTLMRIDKLTEKEIAIMQRLSILPLSGVPFDNFIEWCHIDDCGIINELVDRNWVIHDTEKDYLLLHPIISDIVRNEMTDPFSQCEDMLSSLSIKFARNWDEMIAVERLEYVEYAKSLYHKLPHKIREHFLLFRHIEIIFKNCSYIDLCKKMIGEFQDAWGEEDSVEHAWILFEKGEIYSNIYMADADNKYLLDAIDMMRRVSPDSYDLSFLTQSIVFNYHAIYNKTGNIEKLELAKKYLIESDIELEKSLSNEETRFGSYIISARYDHKTSNQAQKARHLCSWAENAFYYGDYDRAIHLAEKSYQIFHSIYGDNEPDTHTPIKVMAKAYSKLGDFKTASYLISKVIHSREVVWGYNNRFYWRYLEYYSDICYENDKFQESLDILCRIQSLMKGMEDSHPYYLKYIQEKTDKIRNEIVQKK